MIKTPTCRAERQEVNGGNQKLKISLGSDHGGLNLKEQVKVYLLEGGHEIADFGTSTNESCDYPDFGFAAAEAVAKGECDRGIVFCTNGVGISMVANKVPGIRCALCSEPLSAKMTRLHNDANMLALGGSYIGINLALEIVRVFLDTPFSDEENHRRRVEKILAKEKEYGSVLPE